MIKLAVVFTLTLFFLNFSGASELSSSPKVFYIWTGPIPGAIGDRTNHIKIESDGDWTWMSNITDPMLEAYIVPKSKSTGTAVIVIPGGGYGGVAFIHEGSDVANWLNSIGINAFVLLYRLPDSRIMKDKSIGPLQDAQEAVRFVRRHAKEWNIDEHKIGVLGFSAGGHLAATVSTHFNEKVYQVSDTTSARPDFSILVYPVISMDAQLTHRGTRTKLLGKDPSDKLVRHFSNELQVTEITPPAFLVHSMNDTDVPIDNSITYAQALKRSGVGFELHIYEKGGHGYGLATGHESSESTWPEQCGKWLATRGLL